VDAVDAQVVRKSRGKRMLFKNFSKSKKNEKELQIQALSYHEREKTRSLWEETFDEDSREFVDFYYNNKLEANRIWVAQDDEAIRSMVQLNPYYVHLGPSVVLAHYIVGVATKEEYRRQGLMKRILTTALREMYENKEPFTYLMPAKEEYYTPFDFVTVYYQKSATMARLEGTTTLTTKVAQSDDFKELAFFTEELLAGKYRVFTSRDIGYYELLQRQFMAENGEIICVYDGKLLVGYFFYGEYDTIEIMEPVCLDQYKDEFAQVIAHKFQHSEKEIKATAFDFLNENDFKNIVTKPATMVRIVSLENFVRYLKATEPIELVIEVMDEYIEENNGSFLFEIGLYEGAIKKVSSEADITLSISELNALCFYEDIPKSIEIKAETEVIEKLKKIIRFTPIFMNEFV
jgi:predicted acetyltransferase